MPRTESNCSFCRFRSPGCRLQLIEQQPAATEILVERAGFLRDAVANGSYPQVLAALSGH